MKKIQLIFLLILSVGALNADGQSPSVSTFIDKRAILIGEHLQLRIEADVPANSFTITLPELPDSFAHFELVQQAKVDTLDNNGRLKISRNYTLTSFDSGLNILPSFNVNVEPYNNDSSFHIVTDSIPINVSYSPLDSTKTFHDIKPIIVVSKPWDVWNIIAIVIGVIVLLAIIIYLLRRKKKEPRVFDSRLSPLDEALQGIEHLKQQDLVSKSQLKLFYTTLNNILRKYLSRKLQLDLFPLTSSEILMKLQENGYQKETIAEVAGLIGIADAVKYAKYNPTALTSNENLDGAVRILKHIDTNMNTQMQMTK